MRDSVNCFDAVPACERRTKEHKHALYIGLSSLYRPTRCSFAKRIKIHNGDSAPARHVTTVMHCTHFLSRSHRTVNFYPRDACFSAVLAVALCPSVCIRHKSVFYRNGWTDRAGFCHRGTMFWGNNSGRPISENNDISLWILSQAVDVSTT